VKVVFIADVPDVALAGETKEVADGYGRNYLIPKKLAVIANSAASNIVKAQMKQVLVKRAQAEEEMKETAGKIEGLEITIKAKAGEKERLYGSVTSADIAAEIVNVAGLTVDKRKIELEEPIRQLGVYDVGVKFTHDITAAVKVTVEADVVEEEKEEKKPRGKKAEEVPAEEAEAEVKTEDTAIAEVEAEVKAEETEATTEEAEAEVKTEDSAVAEAEAEVKVEETEATAEEAEAEAKDEKPKAKKKAKKKTETEVEE
jgi:large subunit ribosomal protein L9